MNKTLKTHTLYVLLVLLLVVGFSSCVENNAEDAAPRLKVDKINLNVIQTGTLKTGTKASFEIVSNLGYEITSDVDWITPDKPTGKGAVAVVLTIKPNETGDVRTGCLTVKSHDLTEVVTVTQTMDPDTDDGESIGYVYLNEDFSFCVQFEGDDQLATPDKGSTTPVRKEAVAVQYFKDHGYEEFNYAGNCMYMAKHYLKMGKGNQQNGLTILLKNIKPGKSTDIMLTFDAAPVINTKGSGADLVATSIDDTTITVEKLEGPGSVNDATSSASAALSLSSVTSWNQWASQSVTLYGVTAKTRIVIRATQQKMSGYHRFFLDNVKMVKAPRGK